MEAISSVTGIAVPYLDDDVNTDEITPVHRDLHPDFAALLFSRRRRLESGALDLDFPLNRSEFASAAVLVAGRNFGCGSSRESAVWAMLAVGIRAIVARSFSDIYRDNCLKNGLIPVVLSATDSVLFEAEVVAAAGRSPVTVDLVSQIVVGPTGSSYRFSIDAAERTALLEGLDDIGMSLREDPAISEFEHRALDEMPWNAMVSVPGIGA